MGAHIYKRRGAPVDRHLCKIILFFPADGCFFILSGIMFWCRTYSSQVYPGCCFCIHVQNAELLQFSFHFTSNNDALKYVGKTLLVQGKYAFSNPNIQDLTVAERTPSKSEKTTRTEICSSFWLRFVIPIVHASISP